MSRKKILDIIKLTQKRTELIRKIQERRIQNPESLSIRDFFLIIQSGLFRCVSLEEWIGELQKVYDEIKDKTAQKNNKNRLILTGAPIVWPNFKILNIIESFEVNIVAKY